MKNTYFNISEEVQRALRIGLPVVALESTVLTHGLPNPQNFDLGREMEHRVREEGAVPATVAVLNGKIKIGLSSNDLETITTLGDSAIKVSRRDFAHAVLKKLSGGTTVAGTMLAAAHAGIQVFATGGIGGVHKEALFDISTDLQALADTPMIVVCAGAKAILDLPATLEYLETMAVPVIGYQTNEFPAFFSRSSGLNVSVRLDSVEEIAAFARAHWEIGLRSAILVTLPLPPECDIPPEDINPIMEQASREAKEQGIRGQALTPFLLERINQLSEGLSLQANLTLLHNNATLAAKIAKTLVAPMRISNI